MNRFHEKHEEFDFTEKGERGILDSKNKLK